MYVLIYYFLFLLVRLMILFYIFTNLIVFNITSEKHASLETNEIQCMTRMLPTMLLKQARICIDAISCLAIAYTRYIDFIWWEK